MDKVRFACPRCRTIMQTGSDKVGFDVACPQCAHRFKIVESESGSGSSSADAATVAPRQSPVKSASAPPSGSSYYPTQSPQATGYPVQPSVGGSYACPYCHTTSPPIWKSEVSTAGWIVFAVLLITTCVFCFVGLFIRDRYRVCSRCRVRLP